MRLIFCTLFCLHQCMEPLFLFLLSLSCSIYHAITSSFVPLLTVNEKADSNSSNSVRDCVMCMWHSCRDFPEFFANSRFVFFIERTASYAIINKFVWQTARCILLICNTKKARWGRWTFHCCGYLVTSSITPGLHSWICNIQYCGLEAYRIKDVVLLKEVVEGNLESTVFEYLMHSINSYFMLLFHIGPSQRCQEVNSGNISQLDVDIWSKVSETKKRGKRRRKCNWVTAS
jgi:hypothetical protein